MFHPPSSLSLPLFQVISLWVKSYKDHQAHVHHNSHGTRVWTWLLTVFEGGLGLIRIIKKGVTWERKRNPLTMAYNPGFCGQARRGGAGEKGGDFILCEVVLFQKETWRPPSPYRSWLGVGRPELCSGLSHWLLCRLASHPASRRVCLPGNMWQNHPDHPVGCVCGLGCDMLVKNGHRRP